MMVIRKKTGFFRILQVSPRLDTDPENREEHV
jgi:hypothetical protein